MAKRYVEKSEHCNIRRGEESERTHCRIIPAIIPPKSGSSRDHLGSGIIRDTTAIIAAGAIRVPASHWPRPSSKFVAIKQGNYSVRFSAIK